MKYYRIICSECGKTIGGTPIKGQLYSVICEACVYLKDDDLV